MSTSSRVAVHDPVTAYARDVVNGKIMTGPLVRAACRRHLNDLATAKERGLVWDPVAAMRPVEFAERFCVHSKGEWAGQPVILEPWQVFIVGSLFGWKRANGRRRFRKAMVAIARKNGKTTLGAVIGLYLQIADNEPGAEIYCAATKKDQAKLVYDEALRMVQASPWLKQAIQHRKNPPVMYSEWNQSKFEPLGKDSERLDGLNPHGAILDEVHAHPDSGMYDVLDSGMGARRQPLLVCITTAGFNPAGFGAQEWDYAAQIAQGNLENDSYFTYIATLDEDDDPFDESVWIKANPNLGVSVSLEYLREQAKAAKQAPHKLNNFLVKNLNKWTSAEVRWMPMDAWKKAGKPIDLDDLVGRPCYVGMDLSSTTDLTAVVAVFPPTANCPEYRVRAAFYMPEDTLRERAREDRVPYETWATQGFITATEGNVIDREWIRNDIRSWATMYRIEEIAYDPWSASDMATKLQEDGFTVVPVRQGYQSMSEPMKRLLEMILKGELNHGNNPVLTWMAGNVVAAQDPAGNIKPDKSKSRYRIDGIVALIMALDRAVRHGSGRVDLSEFTTDDFLKKLWG